MVLVQQLVRAVCMDQIESPAAGCAQKRRPLRQLVARLICNLVVVCMDRINRLMLSMAALELRYFGARPSPSCLSLSVGSVVLALASLLHFIVGHR